MSFKPASAVVWTEIPVTDMARAMTFYSDCASSEFLEPRTA